MKSGKWWVDRIKDKWKGQIISSSFESWKISFPFFIIKSFGKKCLLGLRKRKCWRVNFFSSFKIGLRDPFRTFSETSKIFHAHFLFKKNYKRKGESFQFLNYECLKIQKENFKSNGKWNIWVLMILGKVFFWESDLMADQGRFSKVNY